MSELVLRNRQRRRPLDLRLLRRITETILRERLGERSFEIGLHIVAAPAMARINEQFLQHSGSTDVITFPYSEAAGSGPLAGDIFICIDDAIRQAREFGATWQAELVRYFVHGVLHLEGYDDLQPAARKTMKREENRIMRAAAEAFPIGKLLRR